MWNSVQCAVQGRGHIKSDTPCQDKTYYIDCNDVEVIALADGAGSAKLSHYGAECVTKGICELLSEQFDIYYGEEDGATVKRVIIGYLVDRLKRLSKELDCKLTELASTLLVAAVHDGKFILIHIGDGVIGYIKENDLKIASHPENGEFVNTTVFVTSKEALQTMKLMKGALNGITGFALMSDGTETCLYNKRDKCLAPVLKKLMELSQFMTLGCLQTEIERSFENVIKNATTDDCSLIFIVEDNDFFHGYNHLTIEQKKRIFGLNNCLNWKKRLKRYDDILKYTSTPKDINQISKKIHLRKKHCIKHLEVLLQKKMIIIENNVFCTSIIMDK